MKVLPIQNRALQKRKALIQAGVEEFIEVGYDSATSKSIAARAGVATGTFYKNFDGKKELLHTIAREQFKKVHEQLNTDHYEGLMDSFELYQCEVEAAIRFVYEFHENSVGLHRVMEQRRYVDPELEQIFEDGEMVVRMRVLKLALSFDVAHPDIVAENIYAMVEGIAHRHALQLKTKKKDQVITEAAKVLTTYFISLRKEQLARSRQHVS